MKKNIIKCFLLGVAMLTAFSSCRKDEFVNEDIELGTGGKTLIKVLEGSEPTVFLDALVGIKPAAIFSIRKDAVSNAALNEATTVTLTYDAALLAAYNVAHPGTPVAEILPDALFTPGAGITRTATGFTVSLAPGEFAKEFVINLNFDLFDFNKKYVFPFKITSSLTGANIVQPTVVAGVSVKNKWDGKYSVSAGFVQRYTAPTTPESGTLSGTMVGNPDVTLSTVNATTVQISGLQWTGAGAGGGIGGVDPITMTIDPVTNKVTQIKSGVATTTMAIVAGATNEYNPTTKTFTLNFNWNQNANKREVLGLVIKYKSAR